VGHNFGHTFGSALDKVEHCRKVLKRFDSSFPVERKRDREKGAVAGWKPVNA
jgi:hypothetical protein